ncbi:hypothetical protein BBJ28_00002379 [Nothophytophthora sp. Chile5]|nr:hypothetical protein BBJ28_00002379 [Nothophytophthora sp. Chile5]
MLSGQDVDRFTTFPALSEPQRTNFVEKLQRFSESDLRQLHENRLVEKAAVLSDERAAVGLFTLRHYATLEQYAPLKRMLWLFEAGSRHDHLEQRAEQSSKKKAGKGTSAQIGNDEEDDDDIWDYPLF